MTSAAPRSSDETADADPDRPERLSDRLYEAIVTLIVTGELEPGQAVSELALARRFDVSRTPVHEAVKRLTQEGLLSQSANRRPTVVALGPSEIYDIYEMRRLLESEAAARAANLLDRGTLRRLDDSLGDFFDAARAGENATADGGNVGPLVERWVACDDAFHAAIANACGSPRLTADLGRYRRLHRAFNRSHTSCVMLLQAAEEHVAILDALRARDPDAARAAMQAHLDEWQRFFAGALRPS